MKNTAVIVAVLLIAATALAQAQSPGFKVVAHPSVSVDSMAAKDLARIFLKQKSRWPAGEHAKPVDQKMSAPVRRSFSGAVLSKTLAAVESYWNGQVFAGRGTPPQTLGSDAEVLDYVRTTPGAVGYVTESTSTPGVKVIRVVD